jgi:hypothetical protein
LNQRLSVVRPLGVLEDSRIVVSDEFVRDDVAASRAKQPSVDADGSEVELCVMVWTDTN